MGFSNIVSQVVLFMSLMVVIVVLSLVYKTYISTSNLSLKTQQESAIEKIDTSFTVLNATYNGGTIVAYMENTGSLKLDPQNVDLYVGSKRIPRSIDNRTIEIVQDKNLVNENLWDPGETIKVIISKALTAGNHLLRASSENGITRSFIIGV